ncbi:SRPBCC family protein [Herbidospora galbida]|uniref:SRPBCC family protein n=1 Tax=Herbidospora galbida TaxID=2575442 RepID=A0A4U3ME07_9ACTN|nr:SRPBCC family protein [Herbidospora galbida]TKK86444.1 SRPBCC family protein [Herbidospora galbida]
MASVRVELPIDAPPAHTWDVIRDVGAVHERLLPGRVAGTEIEDGRRRLTFPDGNVVTELIVSLDDEARRFSYAVVAGARPPLTHHHASFEVRPDGVLVWTADFLPDSARGEVEIRMRYGAAEMKTAIEGARPTP